MTTNIWWVRRDLRLHDNPALQSALADGAQVLPLFVLDPKLLNSGYVGARRKAFLFAGLRALHAELQARGSYLLVRQGDPAQVLAELVAELSATRVVAQADYSPYAQARDAAVSKAVPLILTTGLLVHPPGTVLKADGLPYTVFTPFARKWRTLDLPDMAPPPPAQFSTPAKLVGVGVPGIEIQTAFQSGEAEASARLSTFVDGVDAPVFRYAEARNQVDLVGTSGLSPYLRFGMLSARQAVGAAYGAMLAAPNAAAVKGAEVWLSELIWREFFTAILYSFPFVRDHSFREVYRRIQWSNDEGDFEAWCSGRTGYPLVDAAMRQLHETGWMHNRARMVVASFLTKDLLIDWRWGERWFMQQLVDGDPAANNGGWQWAAGTGTDAAPYFRIFNPVAQSERHDPNGVYIRKYVPELRQVPDRYIHEPWQMPISIQAQSDCILGETYPLPIVDHRWARERTLVAYKQAKEQ